MATNVFSKLFNRTNIGTSETTLYTMPPEPADQTLQDCLIKINNFTTATRVVQIFTYASGGSAGSTPSLSIPPNDYRIVEVEILSAGDILSASADLASSITVEHISGRLHTP